jgi:hypothetical protein
VADRCVRPMDAALAAVPPQAIQCSLAYLKVPQGAHEYAGEARALLGQLLSGGQTLVGGVWAGAGPCTGLRASSVWQHTILHTILGPSR